MSFHNLYSIIIKEKLGFSLIELMVVVTLFGLAASVLTAGYLGFEKNQKLRNAAAGLKSDIRLIQNKALSGDKGVGVGGCQATATLAGWYLKIQVNVTSYKLAGDCLSASNAESQFSPKTVQLPKGTSVEAISYGISSHGEAYVLFRPLSPTATFHAMSTEPDFLNNSGILYNPLSGGGNELKVTLKSSQGADRYQVTIKPSGEIAESKL